jgi:hypothetical protein
LQLELHIGIYASSYPNSSWSDALRYTYSVSFAALIATVASEVSFFGPTSDAVEGGVVFFLLIVVLVLINGFKIEVSIRRIGSFREFANK